MMPFMKMPVIIFTALLAWGCGKPQDKPKEPQPSKIIEDVTGMTAIKQGEYMKKKLKEFEKNEQKHTDEALDRND
jgi:hypothetical protein